MSIIVTDRKNIEAGIDLRSSYVVISIHDPHRRPAQLRQDGNLRGILALAFYDAETIAELVVPDPAKMMTLEQATQVWAFLDEYKAEGGDIVVHCEHGMSRSPAVAAALSRAWGLEENRFWQEYQPNRHVYRLLLQAYRLRPPKGKPS